jgi:hypothetical protein
MSNEETALVPVDTGWAMPPTVVKRRMAEIEEYRAIMREGEDYGTIPGTPKPTLYQPGADTLCIAAGLSVGEPVMEKVVEDWEAGFFYYLVKQPLVDMTGNIVAWGIGSCSSKEDKYAWRWVPTWKLSDEDKARAKTEGWQTDWRFSKKQGKKYLFYRMPNPDPYSQANTVLKMAVKRAYVSATLRATGAHRVFTQDVEDLPREARPAETVDAEFEVLPPEDAEQPTAPAIRHRVEASSPPADGRCPDHPNGNTRRWKVSLPNGVKVEGRKCTAKVGDGWCDVLLGDDGYTYRGTKRIEAQPSQPPAEDPEPEYQPPEEEGLLA